MKRQLMAFALGVLFLAGCSSGNCRQAGQKETMASQAAAKGDVAVKPTDRVRIFKYDGSLQCNQGKPVSVEEMQKELKDIQVFTAEKKQDSVMRIQQCGTNTGKANVFEIDRKNLDAAKKIGFQLWTFE